MRRERILLSVLLILGVFYILYPSTIHVPVTKAKTPGSPEKRTTFELVSWEPRVWLARNFLTLDECEEIIKIGRDSLSRSEVQHRGSLQTIIEFLSRLFLKMEMQLMMQEQVKVFFSPIHSCPNHLCYVISRRGLQIGLISLLVMERHFIY